ncbi:hypothetical protein [Stappia sp. ES.058]|uniref:hypothetical protein n=1 Tax=Stappia sp. ES.058 TaxID=1881061 RepID=UPI00087ADA1E|nr:hypothetical protein [Stappia sp. ES.058]SDU47116.1 hypothetical protein SAMN05428979_4146 [Stappia sp. ES.058]
MRILTGLTSVAALVAFTTAPAIAECNWMKSAQSKMSPVANVEAPPMDAIATNDLSDELVEAGEAEAKAAPLLEDEKAAD